MKSVDDAQRLRARISRVIEHAGLPHLTPEERRRHLSFVVVGGGPTGCAAACLGRAVPRCAALDAHASSACAGPCSHARCVRACARLPPPHSFTHHAPTAPLSHCSVELAAELHDFVQEDVSRLLPHLKVPAAACSAADDIGAAGWAAGCCCLQCWRMAARQARARLARALQPCVTRKAPHHVVRCTATAVPPLSCRYRRTM